MINPDEIAVPSIGRNDINEVLRIYELEGFPIQVKRVFTVKANEGALRGQHAHKKCNQVLCCASGKLELTLKDGENSKVLILDENSPAILMVSGIWGEQKYLEDGTVLIVFCDYPYDEEDYIRDYEAFLQWKVISK